MEDYPVEANGPEEGLEGPPGSSGPIRRAVRLPCTLAPVSRMLLPDALFNIFNLY